MLIGKKNEPTLISVDLIRPNPYQPRKKFKEEDLEELCNSIREYGIIQPLIVKKVDREFILIAGERRLRAAIKLEMKTVPVVIREMPEVDMALIALIENVQRENLSFIEEAIAYKKLIDKYCITQSDLAKKMGKQQSTISNKLRILTLSETILKKIVSSNLSERHARALLRLSSEQARENILNIVIKKNLNVSQTEQLVIEALAVQNKPKKSGERIRFINYKLYVNTIKKAFSCISESEKNAKFFQEDTGDFVEVRIVIPKKRTVLANENEA